MSIFFSAEARPCCKFCRWDLSSRATSGRCPGCNRWYAHSRAEIEPGRVRAVALARKGAHFLMTPEGRTAMQGVATTLIVVGNAAMVVLLARMALKALYRACGMEW